jgi:hypothetical protein
MRIFRLLVEIGTGVWTYVVAANDHHQAWRLVIANLSPQERSLAALEELEAGALERVTGRPRLIRSWLSAGQPLGGGVVDLRVIQGQQNKAA